jgi:hypothetical protein
MSETGRVDYLNPPGLRKNPAFTNVVVASGLTIGYPAQVGAAISSLASFHLLHLVN